MHKSAWILCLQWAAAVWVFVSLCVYAFQQPRAMHKPDLFSPYVSMCAADQNSAASTTMTEQAAFLDASPLFLATALNANCHPKSSLDLSKDLPVADNLVPILSLSENLKVLPLQRTTVEDPLELLQWHYTIAIDPPDIKPLEAIHPFKAEVCNTQLLDLFSSERNLLSLSLSAQNATLPLLEDIHVLVLKDPTGYTLPFFKLNSLGDEALDLKVLEALSDLPMLKEWESAYYEFVSSL